MSLPPTGRASRGGGGDQLNSFSQRSSQLALQRESQPVRNVIIEEPGKSGHFPVDEDSEVQVRSDQVKAFKANLRKLVTLLRRLNADGQRYGKSSDAFASNGLDKLQLAEKMINNESVYAQALAQFAQVQRSFTFPEFHQAPSGRLIASINDFVDRDICTELKNLRNKYKRARQDYDSAVGKVTALRTKAKLDIIKLFNAEKELKRRKKTYEDSLEEVKNKLDEIELKKSCDLVEWLILWFQEERDLYGEAYSAMQTLENYLVELSTWSKEMRAYFEESVQLRNEEQAALIQQEKSAVYNPLHKLFDDPGVVAIIQQVMKQESKNISLPSASGANLVLMHGFIRDSYDTICQELLLAGYREQMRALASAMGLLEKAQEEIQ